MSSLVACWRAEPGQNQRGCQRNFPSSPGQRCQPQSCHLPSPGGSDGWEVGIHIKSDTQIGPKAISSYLHPWGGGHVLGPFLEAHDSPYICGYCSLVPP